MVVRDLAVLITIIGLLAPAWARKTDSDSHCPWDLPSQVHLQGC
jgi:hypothetical protein